jgi:hypothetical protein
MGRSGSSGGRVSQADRNRVVETGASGTFRLSGRSRETFATRRAAEIAARDRRIGSSSSGARQRSEEQQRQIRERLRQRAQRSGD